MSGTRGIGERRGGGPFSSIGRGEVVGRGYVPMSQCIMGNGHMGTAHEQNDRQTPVKTLFSRNLVCGS